MLPLTKSTFYPGQRTLPHSAGAPAAGSPVSRVPLRPELTHGCLPSASSRHASPPNSPPLSLRPLTCAAGSSAAQSPWCCRQPPRPPQCSILPKPALQTLPHFRFPPLPEAARVGGVKRRGSRGAVARLEKPETAAAPLGRPLVAQVLATASP